MEKSFADAGEPLIVLVYMFQGGELHTQARF
jgi:hypothetical protein